MFIELFLTLLSIIIVLPIPVFWVYGLFTAFNAHVLVGVIALVVEPLPWIIGVGNGIWHINIAQMIAELLKLH